MVRKELKIKELKQKVTVAIYPEDLKLLDDMAKEMGTSRSGILTYFIRGMKAVSEGKGLNDLLTVMVERAKSKG